MDRPDEGAWFYEQHDLGLNYRLTEMQAALGVSQFRHLDEWVARRHQIADAYDRDLAGLPLILPRRSSDSLSGLHLYVVQVAGANLSRRQVFDAMRAAGIGVNVHYIPVHTQPYYLARGSRRAIFRMPKILQECALPADVRDAGCCAAGDRCRRAETGVGRMTTAIIVQARMTSTRLPGKVMMPLGGRPMLACLLERLRRVTLADKIIVATTTNATDDVIAEFCGEEGVSLHRGSEADVLSRYAEAVRKHDVDVVVRVTSDCPLLDPLLVDRIIGVYQQGQERRIDYVSNMLEPTCPYGMAVEVFSRKALLEADAEASDPAEREHVTPFIYWRPERYVLEAFKLDTDLSSYRWTVDTPEDFELVQLLYNEIYPVNPLFTMSDVVELMDSHPARFHINQHIEQIKPVSICHGRSMNYKTDQESFWAGEFGTEYIQRNTGPALLASNLDFCEGVA